MELQVREGRPVTVASGAAALAEAELLERLVGLRVPQVVAVEGRTVTTTWAPPLAPAATDWAAVADTLAAAHDRGVTHGALSPECVRAGPVVSGWRGDGEPADDVAALGSMLPDPVLARRATAEDPASRPTMRAIADALAMARPASPAHRTRFRARYVLPVAPILLFLAVVLGGSLRDRHAVDRAATAPVLTSGTTTWSAGEPGDVAVAADLDCDGIATPLLLHPATGAIWSFPDWAPTARPTRVQTAPGATGLRVVADGGCDRLRISR